MAMRIRTLAVTAALAPAALAASRCSRSWPAAAPRPPPPPRPALGASPRYCSRPTARPPSGHRRSTPGCTGMRWPILAGIGMAESSQAAGHHITPGGEVTSPIYGVPLDGSGTGGNTTPVYNDGGYARAVGPCRSSPPPGHAGHNGDGQLVALASSVGAAAASAAPASDSG